MADNRKCNRKPQKGNIMEKIWIGKELHCLNHMIRRYFEFSSCRREVETITGNNGWIIKYLAENTDRDIYQRDIEDHFTIARSTASKVLRLMEQKGLIARQSVAHDARLKKIVLTEKAWELRGLMRQDAEQMEATLTRGFTEEELQWLSGVIERMKENISAVSQNKE